MHFFYGLSSFIFIIVGFALVFGIGTIVSTTLLQLRLRRQTGLTRSEFVAAMPVASEHVAQAVFDEYRKESFASNFKLSPDCELRRVFAQESEDIFDMAKQISAQRGLLPPGEVELNAIANAEKFTASDLVQLLTSLDKRPP